MKVINHSIVGSGLSALIKDHVNKNSTVFSNNDDKIIKSERFYEYLSIGGNTNIWGGYINYRKFSILLKNKKFYNFYKKQKIFKIRKIFKNLKFDNTYYLSDFNNFDIFRVSKNKFLNPFIEKNIDKISFESPR